MHAQKSQVDHKRDEIERVDSSSAVHEFEMFLLFVTALISV